MILSLVTATYAGGWSEKKAEKYFEQYSFDKAIKRYTDIDTLNVEQLRKLALSYKNRQQYSEAAATYSKFADTNAATANDCYDLVLMLKAQAKYEEAAIWMDNMAMKFPKDLRVKNYLDNRLRFPKYMANNPLFKLENLAINSENDDFGTCYFNNQVVYASNSIGEKIIKRRYNWTKRPFFDMVVADMDSVELAKPRLFNKTVNQKWHEGPASFAKNATIMAFTRNNYEGKSSDDVVKLEIFFSQLENGVWSKPEAFYLNDPEYSVGHPYLTADGNTMYFASDMPGGLGGTDIYYVKKIAANKWGEPVNLGEKINTEGNEMFPFLEENNKVFFFASDGKAGLGGLDIFSADFTGKDFENVENMGAPVNTRWDDFALIYDKNMRKGFISSNRDGGKGGDDIYRFAYTGSCKKVSEIAICDSIKNYTYKLAVLNAETGNPVPKAAVTLGSIAQFTDNKGEVSAKFPANSSFNAQVTAMGYVDNVYRVEIKNSQKSAVVYDTVSMKINKKQAIVLHNIYYDFDKWDLLPESTKELDKVVDFLKQNPQLKIELSSHTDCRGSYDYNRELSKKRALSAIMYILDSGIERERLSAKGYGESRPVNGCVDGVDCTEQEHRQNRRTEVFIEDYGRAQDILQTKGKE